MIEKITDSFGEQRLLAGISGAFSLAALLLSSVGLYGIMSFKVSRQRKEIGIRSALGATPARVVGEVLRQGLRLSLVGALLGLGLLAVSSSLIKLPSIFFGVGLLDPASLLASLLILGIVSLLACLIPAQRAVGVDPITALRCD